jgi:hypothetical protein
MLMHLVNAPFEDANTGAAPNAVKEMTLINLKPFEMNDSVRPTGHPQQTCTLIDPEEETQKPDLCTSGDPRGIASTGTTLYPQARKSQAPNVNPILGELLRLPLDRMLDLLALDSEHPRVGLTPGLAAASVGDQSKGLKPGEQL